MRAKSDARNKYQRAKRQWEADEKAAFEKALAGKTEGMKKAAADSFGPQVCVRVRVLLCAYVFACVCMRMHECL